MPRSATFDFTGQSIFITGGGTGIGAGIAKFFAQAGGHVTIGGRRLEPLQTMAAAYPGRIGYVQMDVGLEADRRRTLDTIMERHGRLDVLINSAMAFTGGPFAERTPAEINHMFGILLEAPTCFIQQALPYLETTRGCVVNISSVVGRAIPYPPQGFSVYAAAKAGLNQLTRALASELGPRGVRLNAVAPGPTATEATDKAGLQDPAILKPFVDGTPLGRFGQPSDVASLVGFLASDAGGWVTGQVIDVSGGWHMT